MDSIGESSWPDFAYYSIEERVRWIFDHYAEDEILMTSSFGSSSALLLHLIHKISPDHPIYFLETGYHFEETLAYKERLQQQLKLNIKTIGAPENKHRFTEENFTYEHNQDLCCFINKVEPLSTLRKSHKIWLSGLFKYQNENRKQLGFFDRKADLLKVYPLLDMTPEEVHTYFFIHELPSHELVAKGYSSIGCTHCTVKGSEREGRWSGKAKVECGIHL
ncbi:phosphoadenylyl-sulfate reductase [Marivirga sp. S37H4]|uniref:Adenosine 5'-phosphosulfate reductase n=1 Tax=Marivirga aurantiaca TaxID=2802615 RepID=A0A934WYB1_9BACT|nr:phosphoadenylyl-sulfate reductase [Marivirga aurantiaca]MBK6265065.1 phosphoadenylyl-sulfate reductase [Marivirga aurantiaca]